MPRVLLLPGLNAFGELKRNAMTQEGLDVTTVTFDDKDIAGLYEIFKAPVRNLIPMASMLIKARRIYTHWVSQAQMAYDDLHPDIVVASSRGASVAITMKVDHQTPMLLLAPAYRWFSWIGGSTTTNHPNVSIIHSRQDERIPFADSENLCRKCPQVRLIEAGIDHSLNTPEATAVWVQEIDRLLHARNV